MTYEQVRVLDRDGDHVVHVTGDWSAVTAVVAAWMDEGPHDEIKVWRHDQGFTAYRSLTTPAKGSV